MNFDLNADERELQLGIRDLCAGRFSLVPDVGFDRAFWSELGEAGVFTLTVPESDGGVGLGVTQAVLVFEELGRALVPGPLVGTFLGGIGSGRVVGLVERDAPIVEYLESLDQLAVLDEDGIWLVDPSEVTASPIEQPLDPLTPFHRLEELPQGELIDGAETVSRWRLQGTVLTAALAGGIAGATVDLAVGYAKEREQFGRPIGSFQAVKHLCADMLVRSEVARAAVHAAGVLLDERSDDAHRAVHAAKLLASEAAIANGKTCIQVHGGMGFTWEATPHLYLKRAMVLAAQFDGADSHADAMLAHL